MTIRGIGFPFGKSSTSYPSVKEDDDLIEDNIRRILLTKRGERVMRPDAGSDMFDFVFENIGAVMRAGISQETRRALASNERRIRVVGVEVLQQDGVAGSKELIVVVTYEANRQISTTAISI